MSNNVARTNTGVTASDSTNHRHSRNSNFVNPAIERNLFQFFIKPHLTVIGLDKKPVKVQYSIWGKLNEVDGYIWSLRIKNKYPRLSKSVKDCTAYLYFSKIGKEMLAKWNTGLPRDSKYDILPTENLDYLGYAEVASIMAISSNVADIPAGESKSLFLFFTFDKSEYAYIVMDQHGVDEMRIDNTRVHGFNGNAIRLPIGDVYELILRYNDEIRGRKHILRVHSFDDVEVD